jgi:AcrR family transcriptional regulator
VPPAPRRSSAARTLTPERVVEEAAALVDEAGIDALNMRVLAERLGVSAMTPYRFVGSKEQLLARLADRFMGEVELPAGGSWEDRVRGVFRSVRRVLLRHPALATIVATQRVNGPASYQGAEVVLAALDQAGLPDEVAVSAFASLTAFTVGFAQREVAGAREQLPERMATLGLLEAAEFPHVTRSAGRLLARDSEQHFETGLDLLIGGIKGVAR